MDRNPQIWTLTTHKILSLSARRAWIEIAMARCPALAIMVALRKESVDRNTLWEVSNVDRWVALRKESVDRNRGWTLNINGPMKSLSARRAWIEIMGLDGRFKL